MTDLWTLTELAARAAVALGDTAEQASARVREVPDPRTIRWYQTTGLIDRPLALRGRTALYGRHHLLQLVAIKRLQAEGRSLAEIQASLAGLSAEALEAIADLPPQPSSTIQADISRDSRAMIRTRFWTERNHGTAGATGTTAAHLADETAASAPTAAAPPADSPGVGDGSAPTVAAPSADSSGGRDDLPAPAAPPLVQGVHLADGVLLILDHPAGTIDPADTEALREAAAPLLDALARRGLVANHTHTKEPA